MRVQHLGRRPYAGIEAAMRDFTAARTADTDDELWLVEHDPVYTQGIAGRATHVHDPGAIPVVATQRGGQVTYHGPGQVVAYPLVDLARLRLHVREYVYRLEEAGLRTLSAFGVTGHRVRGAPGLYVRLDDPFGHHAPAAAADEGGRFLGLGKIVALGIKVARHRAFHGLALNVAMDLAPFGRIDPCGYAGLQTVDLRGLGLEVTWDEAAARLALELQRLLAP